MTKQEFVAMVRQQNPQLAQLVDEVKEVFPGATVSYLRHGEQEIGKRMEGVDIVPPPYIPPVIKKGRKRR